MMRLNFDQEFSTVFYNIIIHVYISLADALLCLEIELECQPQNHKSTITGQLLTA